MKNLKKLNRNELRTISGNGLLDNIVGVANGLGGVVSGAVNGAGAIVGGVVGGAVGTVGGAVGAAGNLAGTTLCQVQCVINGVVTIKLLACGSTC